MKLSNKNICLIILSLSVSAAGGKLSTFTGGTVVASPLIGIKSPNMGMQTKMMYDRVVWNGMAVFKDFGYFHGDYAVASLKVKV